MAYLHENPDAGLGAYGWWVRSLRGVVPEGHEVLTRNAASGLPISAAEQGFLVEGVRRPDEASLVAHVTPSEQRRHFLRSTIIEPVSTAWTNATNHLRGLHGRVMTFGTSRAPEQFRLMGEALHLIQDAFAPAHVNRSSSGRVTFIKNFGPTTGAITDHGFPVDPRDRIHSGIISPTLKPEAGAAIAASRDYLTMALRHIGGGVSPATIAADVTAFIGRRLSM